MTKHLLETKFWSKVKKGAASECWEWQAAKRQGYGYFRNEGAHRWSYRLSNGEFLHSMWVLHRCDNPGCVNPKHLFLGNRSANMLDASAKGRLKNGLIEANARKTHCPKGHPFDEKNTLLRKDRFQRECRACKNLRSKERYLKGKK